ncbi:hypothetical protein O7606_10290 [Micromonospora sp. WMMD882]|uniref:hypothetical protein n=1 Tax=Micromonospora sp. WMMD882 TaxID=3015151 RepID=UPI00248B52AF|nr:hypothetical protein [Micromonospora sp. WMMD882]WBB81711.1 hypothetical protein O7606_10290 [Micromonospora sp. WMMD882]
MVDVAVAVVLLLAAITVAVGYARWRRRRVGGPPSGNPPGPLGAAPGTAGRGRRFPAPRLSVRRLVPPWRRTPDPWPDAGRIPTEVTVLCLDCRGRGWIDRRERTLDFTGAGFADVERPPTMCVTCSGSGQVTR